MNNKMTPNDLMTKEQIYEQELIWKFSIKLIEEFRKCGMYFTKEMAENITYCQAKIPAHHKPEMDFYLNAEEKWKEHTAVDAEFHGSQLGLPPQKEVVGAITNIGPEKEKVLFLKNTKPTEVVRESHYEAYIQAFNERALEKAKQEVEKDPEKYEKANQYWKEQEMKLYPDPFHVAAQQKNIAVGGISSGAVIGKAGGTITNMEQEGSQCSQTGIIPLNAFTKMLGVLLLLSIALTVWITVAAISQITSNGQPQPNKPEIVGIP